MVFRRFDTVSRSVPAGYVPLGDSIATFSPINAQGISVAALQAKALDTALTTYKQHTNWQEMVVREYVKEAAIPASWAWMLGQSLDRGFDELHDHLDPAAVELGQSIEKVAQHSATKPDLIGAMGKVLHLLESPDKFAENVREILAN